MDIYLMRHADACNDTGNPLSPQGRHDSEKMGLFFASRGIVIEKIFHSAKLRAKETAVIIAPYAGCEKKVIETEGIGPLDDAVLWADRLQSIESNLLIVSHMPFLPKLFSALLCGYADENLVQFPTASVVCMRRLSVGMWALQWMVTPEVLI
ncbi:MAG TPA: phosphohistidine phosphatase SixA [Dissulfurispiraceae bacterium]|nr:phosphohistidine phosphatase SixA [Dissulfurispiraceae bacterium]